MVAVAVVFVISDDLAGVVDALGGGEECRTASVDGGVGAAALDEPRVGVAAAASVMSDDLAGGVDANGDGASRTRKIDDGVGAATLDEPMIKAPAVFVLISP
jgi:hypothetical protein